MRLIKSIPRAIRFLAVGGAAATVHFICVVFFVEYIHLPALIANIGAFLIAFLVSFTGQRFLTFHDSQTSLFQGLKRFFLIALSSFVVNECLFAIAIEILNIPYMLALACVLLIVAVGTYFSSKHWAFKV